MIQERQRFRGEKKQKVVHGENTLKFNVENLPHQRKGDFYKCLALPRTLKYRLIIRVIKKIPLLSNRKVSKKDVTLPEKAEQLAEGQGLFKKLLTALFLCCTACNSFTHHRSSTDIIAKTNLNYLSKQIKCGFFLRLIVQPEKVFLPTDTLNESESHQYFNSLLLNTETTKK